MRSRGARALVEWVKDVNDALASASAQRRSHADAVRWGKVGGIMKLWKWKPPSFSFLLCSLTPSVGGLGLAWSIGRAREKRPFLFFLSSVDCSARRAGEGGKGLGTGASRRLAQLQPENKPCVARDPSGWDRTVITITSPRQRNRNKVL